MGGALLPHLYSALGLFPLLT